MPNLKCIRISAKMVFFLFFLFGFYACFNEKEIDRGSIIDIELGLTNVRSLYLSNFADNVAYIPLESKSGFELMNTAYCIYKDTLFLVSDGRICLLFSEDGKILNRIGSKGRGPGEYSTIGWMEISPDNSILIQNYISLMQFNRQGEHIRTYESFKNISLNAVPSVWKSMNDSLIFVHVSNAAGEVKNKAVIIYRNGEIYKEFQSFNKTYKPENNAVAGYSQISSAYIYSGNLGFKEAFNDTLFYIGTDLQLRTGYVFNMGEYSVTYQDLMNNSAFSREYAYTTRNIFETEGYILFDLIGLVNAYKRTTPIVSSVRTMSGQSVERSSWYYSSRLLVVFDKNTHDIFLADILRNNDSGVRQGFVNDIDGGLRFYPSSLMDEDRLIMSIQPHELKSHVASEDFRNAPAKYPEKKKALEELASSLSNDDNPVLMVVTMRQ